MCYGNGIVIEDLAQVPSRLYGDASIRRRYGVSQMPLDGFVFFCGKCESRIPLNGDDYGSIIILVDIQEFNSNRSIRVKVLYALDQFGLCFIGRRDV